MVKMYGYDKAADDTCIMWYVSLYIAVKLQYFLEQQCLLMSFLSNDV